MFPKTLVAAAFFGLLTLGGVALLPEPSPHTTQMIIRPSELTLSAEETFRIDVIVLATIPVNAFTGVLEFDETKLTVDRIEYNTSIADLWAEEPWFNKGNGTISFAGGSTKTGGFTGAGSVITVYFKSLNEGTTNLKLSQTRILQHDGLGTDVILPQPLDALFTVTPLSNKTVITAPQNIITLHGTDLNQDGTTNFIDISIFMIHLTTQNTLSDFNGDDNVTGADLSIILANRD